MAHLEKKRDHITLRIYENNGRPQKIVPTVKNAFISHKLNLTNKIPWKIFFNINFFISANSNSNSGVPLVPTRFERDKQLLREGWQVQKLREFGEHLRVHERLARKHNRAHLLSLVHRYRIDALPICYYVYMRRL